MKISYNWLKTYLNINLPPEEVAEILTDTGLEIEGIEYFESIKGGLQGLIIGEVKEKWQHPNADKLSCTKVDIGTDELLDIVCGAPNVEAGQKVVVATIGTTLYMNDDSFKIKKAKIRGKKSEGMICAEDEIGLGDSHEGIIILPEDVEVGTLANEYFKIEKDVVFEIGLTPNRIDGASHIGAARDLYAYLNFHQKQNIELKKPDVSNFKSDNNNLHIPVEVKNTEACPRYSGLTISGIKVGDSPDWLKNRLKAIGQRPLNNIVDITNYVLHETGQPLHAFDCNRIEGNKVIVKTLSNGTSFTTLDEVERKLSGEDLMICNGKEDPMCIAGVFGGVKSGVTKHTNKIFLESACFDSVFVRKTSKKHLLHTDAAFRFERGSDIENTVYALKRAALLIKEIAGGEISSEVVDVYPKKYNKTEIKLRFSQVNRLIGKTIAPDDVVRILELLDFEIFERTQEFIMLKVPTYRVDVTREADVIEEILRIYGYNNVEMPETVHSTLSYINKPDKTTQINVISDYLASNGFFEAMCNSLSKSDYYSEDGMFKAEHLVKILNPLSTDMNVMRQSLLFGGLESVQHNINHKNHDLKLFEFGNCYTYKLKKSNNEGNLSDYVEQTHLSLIISGNKQQVNWNTPESLSDFYYLKSYVENILKRLNYNIDNFKIEEFDNDIYDYGMQYKLNGSDILCYGSISRKLLKEFDIGQEVFFAEINWDLVLKNMPGVVKYNPISKFPEVKRDLALLLDNNIKFEEIKNLAYKTEKKFLKNVNIFDVYKDKKLGSNKKSYAISFVFENKEKTFTDKQIDKMMNKIASSFEHHLSAEIRK